MSTDDTKRPYRWWEELPPDELNIIHARIVKHEPAAAILAEHHLNVLYGVNLRTLQEYATNYRDQATVNIAKERLRIGQKICKLLGVDLEALDPGKRLAVMTNLEVMSTAGGPAQRLRAVDLHNAQTLTQLKKKEDDRKSEKHDWAVEQERRKEQADRQVETIGKREGLSQDAIDKIKAVYGLAVGSGDDGDNT